MKVVVMGGSEAIGRKLLDELLRDGHDALAAAAGEGLAEALAGAQVVVDVAGCNLLADEAAAGVAHHVLLSVAGADRVAREGAVKAGPVPYTIVRITPLFEDVRRVAEGPAVLAQPVAAADVASALADVAAGTPLDDTIELAGPEAFPVDAGSLGDVPDGDLIPGDGARIGPTDFEDWLSQSGNTR